LISTVLFLSANFFASFCPNSGYNDRMNLRRFFALLALFLFLGIARAEIQATSAGARAECMDGMYSTSSGSGTCSWHGGVRHWLIASNPPTGTMAANLVSEQPAHIPDAVKIARQLRWICIGIVLGSFLCGAVTATTLIAANAGIRKVPKLEYLRKRLLWLLAFALFGTGCVLLARLLWTLGLLYL
jgi:hypothetical protein